MRLHTIAATLALSFSIGLCSDAIALAQGYVPPDMGIPGRRRGAGTRGDLCVTQGPSLTALAPQDSYGQSIDSTPTWFWYLPQTTASAVEFVLLDSEGNAMYQTTIAPSESGIVSFSLPDTAALTPDANYHWFFSIICNPDDRSEDIYTEGWIRRVNPEPDLMQQIEAAAPVDRAAIYAEHGLWYDAIATLAALRRSEPENAAVTQQWQALLDSVELSDLAAVPLSSQDLPSTAPQPEAPQPEVPLLEAPQP